MYSLMFVMKLAWHKAAYIYINTAFSSYLQFAHLGLLFVNIWKFTDNALTANFTGALTSLLAIYSR